jgi:hypothetical protein
MTKYFIVFLVLFSTTSFAQDSLNSFSYYFENSNCSAFDKVENISDSYFGTYTLTETKANQFRVAAGDDMILDETGLYIQKNKLLNISRTEIRENSKYNIRNGYLHGITKTDSFAVALQGEAYYFLMPTKAFLFEANHITQKIYKSATNAFIVLTKEDNNYYSALQVTFNKGQILMAELDLSYNQIITIKNTEITENNIKTFILNPSKKDWTMISKGFVGYDSYVLK